MSYEFDKSYTRCIISYNFNIELDNKFIYKIV